MNMLTSFSAWQRSYVVISFWSIYFILNIIICQLGNDSVGELSVALRTKLDNKVI